MLSSIAPNHPNMAREGTLRLISHRSSNEEEHVEPGAPIMLGFSGHAQRVFGAQHGPQGT